MTSGKQVRLEAVIREMTRPLNGQYPRPWMTKSTDPASSEVFTVGMNQRNGFPAKEVGSHEHYINALFNRGPESCRQLYDRRTDKPSPTRRNTDDLVARLGRHGVTNVLETNVICYSTPMSADLRQHVHVGGKERGRELFAALLQIIAPKVMIAHGSGTATELARLLGHPIPPPPQSPGEPVEVAVGDATVIVIPSLAPPGYNRWSRWAPEHLDHVCRHVAALLARTRA
ncbi:MAG TPA: hypothetical protein VGN97_02830 [Mesorhizobium sp.]|jgi:hypothetical protein|nr:hypothetical protein [Mesorhizobium sp.]